MQYKFCPKCGSALENVFIKHEGYERLRCTACGFIFYQNSKPTASTLVVNDGMVLLGKRGIEPSKGTWNIPGGFLELGEHPEVGAVREAREEAGVDVAITNLLGVFMDYHEYYGNTLNFGYTAKIINGAPTATDELTDFHWFGLDDLPHDIAFKSNRDVLNAWLEKNGRPKLYA